MLRCSMDNAQAEASLPLGARLAFTAENPVERNDMYRIDEAPLMGAGRPETTPIARAVQTESALIEGAQRRIGLSPAGFVLKRAFDLVSVVALFALFGWLMLLIALLVRMSGGRKVIYGHTRVGRDGKLFQCLKFRSMVLNSDEVLRNLLETDPDARAQWERDFKLKDDPRITRIGRFIRKTSLDELPQLWNVLRGEMSMVGPRPVVQAELEQYYGDVKQHYLSVPPGLTGLWQVSGRNDLDYAQRVALDKSYVENSSVLYDLTIMVRTLKVMVASRGAY
jgi:exopolysaccharide production protein ExoY